jgi:hypothetical protein
MCRIFRRWHNQDLHLAVNDSFCSFSLEFGSVWSKMFLGKSDQSVPKNHQIWNDKSRRKLIKMTKADENWSKGKKLMKTNWNDKSQQKLIKVTKVDKNWSKQQESMKTDRNGRSRRKLIETTKVDENWLKWQKSTKTDQKEKSWQKLIETTRVDENWSKR